MTDWALAAIILGLSALFLVVFGISIAVFGNRTQYWQRHFGAQRHWDLGQLGNAVSTYRVDPDDSSKIELELKFHRNNGEELTASWCFERRNDVEREVFGLFVDAPESWVQKEVGELMGYSEETVRKFGIRRKPSLVRV